MVAPAITVITALLLIEPDPLSASVPEATDVPPEYELVPEKLKTPGPDLVNEPVPRMGPAWTCATGLANVSAELFVITPARAPMRLLPSPSCNVPEEIKVPPV